MYFLSNLHWKLIIAVGILYGMGMAQQVSELAPPVHAELLSVSEVSAIFRVSKMTIYRMVHAGELEHVRVGKTYRIFADSVRGRLTF